MTSDAEKELTADSSAPVAEAPQGDGVAASDSLSSEGETVEASPMGAEEPAPEPAAPKAVVADPAPMGAEAEEEVVEEVEEEDEEEDNSVLPKLEPHRAAYPWYVVHTYSGYEQRAKLSLEERIKTANATDKFGHVLVPQEKVVELVKGEKKTSSRKTFPGYIVVQCLLDDEAWHLIKATPKITDFVGDSRNPVPLSQPEIDNIIAQLEGSAERPRPKVNFEEGDSIKVVDGPFAEFNGTVDEVKPDKGKLRVLISIFGRNTPVELDFVQVEKV